MKTYGIIKGIYCLKCGKTSYNPTDIAQKYCGHCHQFHVEELPLTKEEIIADANAIASVFLTNELRILIFDRANNAIVFSNLNQADTYVVIAQLKEMAKI